MVYVWCGGFSSFWLWRGSVCVYMVWRGLGLWCLWVNLFGWVNFALYLFFPRLFYILIEVLYMKMGRAVRSGIWFDGF